MPIGLLIGALIGLIISSGLCVWVEIDAYNGSRAIQCRETTNYRSKYFTLLLASIGGLIGTIIELAVR
jgi:hypothetical protein